jgi:hypothetical protein
MIRFLQPQLLLPGVLAAVIITTLHFVVRSPPARAPLPTLRFLSAAPRSAVRLRRRPRDVALLALRVLFALCLTAAFAGPVWTARGVDHVTVLLIDRGAGMADVWDAAIDSARAHIRDGAVAGRAVAVVLFDTTAVWTRPGQADSTWLESVRAAGPAAVESDYRVAFQALARGAGSVAAQTYAALLVTAPRWSAWHAGTATLREAAWPAALQLVALHAPQRDADTVTPRVAARPGTPLFDAVQALGWSAVPDSVRDAVAVVRHGDAAGRAAGWVFVGDSVVRADDVVFDGGWTAPAIRSGAFVRGPAATGRAIGAWRDGALAAVAAGGRPCTVTTAFDPDDPVLTAMPEYPELIRHLVISCADARTTRDAAGAARGAPLDSGAERVLRGTGSAMVPASALPVLPAGRSLSALLMLAALFCAAAEWPLRRRMDRAS